VTFPHRPLGAIHRHGRGEPDRQPREHPVPCRYATRAEQLTHTTTNRDRTCAGCREREDEDQARRHAEVEARRDADEVTS